VLFGASPLFGIGPLELRELREQREQFLRRVERELEEARQFQLSLLPPTGMELPGLSIAARYLACNELAGDIYDYVEASAGAVAVLIADVVGHGTSAAMMTGVVKAAFRASHVDGFEPMAVVDRVKEGIRDFDPSRFVSLCCARIDLRRGELRYVNAGHPEPIIRSGTARPMLLDSTGPILSSALFDIPCEQATAALGPGDSLLLDTDGVTESHSPGGCSDRSGWSRRSWAAPADPTCSTPCFPKSSRSRIRPATRTISRCSRWIWPSR
jgi:sigma-B regulation protein RsbU (phosphoserine phosphatase)